MNSAETAENHGYQAPQGAFLLSQALLAEQAAEPGDMACSGTITVSYKPINVSEEGGGGGPGVVNEDNEEEAYGGAPGQYYAKKSRAASRAASRRR